MKKSFYPDLKKTFEEGNFNTKIYNKYLDNYLLRIECTGEKCNKFCQFKKSFEYILNKHKNLAAVKKQNEEVFYQILHDIKSPMIGIKLALENLNRSETEEEIYAISQNTLSLIRDFLTVYNFESGYRGLSSDIVCLNEIINAKIAVYASQLRYKNLKVRFQTGSKKVLVCSDAVIVERILSNLISNAIKYAPKNTTVIISINKNSDYSALCVSNQTSKPFCEAMNNLFEKFNTDGDDTSFGLGLYICKRLAKKINTKITAVSKNGLVTFKLIFKN